MSILETYQSHKQDLDDIANWIDQTYDENFRQYFEVVENLYARFKSETYPITDAEIEAILTILPLNLFSVSEKLAQLESSSEVIKLRVKQKKYEIIQSSEASSQAAKKEEAANAVVDDEILLKAYEILSDRVNNEISFSRELIMGAKKIWSARKQTETIGIGAENVNTNREIDELPEYRREL